MKDALIIVSGGMDSVTMLHEFKSIFAHAISFSYGSKHNNKEIPMAVENCKRLNIPHQIIKMDFIKEAFKSSLLQGGGEVPKGHYADETMRSTVVPFRNAIMLSIAVGFAESRGLSRVFIGAHSGDHHIYPDCRPKFLNAIREAATLGTYKAVDIVAPYAKVDKGVIASRGKSVGVDYSLTWTCYDPKDDDLHCGTCGACTERKEALEGFDPTKYRA